MSLDFIIRIAAEMVAHRLVGLKHNYKLYKGRKCNSIDIYINIYNHILIRMELRWEIQLT